MGSDTAHRTELPDAFFGVRNHLPRVPATGRPHFFGGALIALTYESGDAFEGTPHRARIPGEIPDLSFAVHDTFAETERGTVRVVSWGLTPDGTFDPGLAMQRARKLEERLRSEAGAEVGAEVGAEGHTRRAPEPRERGTANGAADGVDETSSLTPEHHTRGVRQLLEFIRAGDIYQGNLTTRVETRFDGDPADLFARLVRDNPAPHAAFWEAPEFTAVSSSPERLLAVRGRRVESRPIKGTAARSDDAARDREAAEGLRGSAKDQAELLMITDLVRN
ncbi:MAG: hypothetical protein HKN12_01015, partial [Gemmatimonadetes bacterium]|nr:hypothetical protein [Gemmatimonadota bacterium]